MPFCPKGKTHVSVCAKYTLFFLNLIFWLAGGTILGAGIWGFEERSRFQVVQFKTAEQFIFDVSILFIIIGALVFIIAFFGFVGALREKTCLLKFFTYSLMAIFFLEIALAVYSFVQKDQLKEGVSEAIQDAYIKQYLEVGKEDNNAVANYVQENFKCCGADSYLDWNLNEYFNCTTLNKSGWRCTVPYSCCRQQDNVNTMSTSHIYTIGCIDAVLNLAEENLVAIVAVALAVLVPQFVGMFLGRRLTVQIEYQREEASFSMD